MENSTSENGCFQGGLPNDGASTLNVDFANALRDVTVALPTDFRREMNGALESLELGLLPTSQFNGQMGAQNRNLEDPELRLKFVTPMKRDGKPVMVQEPNFASEPQKFIEYLIADPVKACVLSHRGACVVNVPAPERLAVHKLLICSERPVRDRTKAVKDVLQNASLIDYFLRNGQAEVFNVAWHDALDRGKGWRARALQGKEALIRLAPELDEAALWHS